MHDVPGWVPSPATVVYVADSASIIADVCPFIPVPKGAGANLDRGAPGTNRGSG